MRYTPRWVDESAPRQLLAVGHVISCKDFATGLRWKATPKGPVTVAWSNHAYVDHHIASGKATPASDPSRAHAKFLVTSIALVEGDGPEDVFPDSNRYSRQVVCVRLSDDLSFTHDSERIDFSLNEPMSIAEPKENRVEILGAVALPIYWEGGSKYQ